MIIAIVIIIVILRIMRKYFSTCNGPNQCVGFLPSHQCNTKARPDERRKAHVTGDVIRRHGDGDDARMRLLHGCNMERVI